MANLVMNCGVIVGDRKALRATFVCTAINTAVENTGCTNDIQTISPSNAPMELSVLFLCVYLRKIRFLGVLRGEVSTVGEHSCKNGDRHADRHAQAD